ncbi:MAG TPA: aldo/keto reductase [Firmicutes bacterium]|jgi:predicted aldo/keto reductase-like oxidoreductase|nr:aldo/keto reductase [Bacillota bacterium]HBR23325.1 aldo/keto reductase [Bacillota bacterium]HCF91667.1 aldo/keto reductase [Bacillota bacterium]
MTLQRCILGKSGISVSELAFGTLPMGPMQANLTPEDGAKAIVRALELGVNFIDTATMYRTYEPIRLALTMHPTADVVINSKSAAATYEDMERDIELARTSLGRYPDIFMLHGARAAQPIEERPGAIECLCEYKAKGRLRAIGISTHYAHVAKAVASLDYIDVVHPLINRMGLGIMGGTREEMVEAIALLGKAGKGVYAMKALGGGNGLDQFAENISYVRNLEGMQAIAVGMISPQEVETDVAFFENVPLTAEMQAAITDSKRHKRIVVQAWCEGCGACVQTCPSGAISLQDGKAHCDPSKCVLCGYCTPGCPAFAIRVV